MPTQELLIEILTEELPAIPFLKEWQHIPSKWNAKMAESRLKADFKLHFTPRRIAIFSRSFPTHTDDETKEFFGPPLHIAYTNGDKNQGLSNAGQSFLKKAQISENEIQDTTKDGKEVLYAKQVIKGVKSCKILPKIIGEFLASLNFGKSMRWGDCIQNGGVSFIRPIVNIMILINGKRINPLESSEDFSGFGEILHFGQGYLSATKMHRDKGFEWVEISGIDDYLSKLESNGVVLDENERKKRILAQIKEIEKKEKIKVKDDGDLLDEIVAITEYPTALLGSFEKRFLDLPKEVIQTSARENQRYFVAHSEPKNELCNHFIFVANSLTHDYAPIIKGNEKVLKARLSDAEFFYHNDLKKPFSDERSEEKLDSIAFVDNLGSMLDKTRRERAIGAFLSKYYGLSEAESSNVDLALRLSKVDLLSEMVGEFPELQGIMGGYYAKQAGLDSSICEAIKEQYQLAGHNYHSKISAISAMSAKCDSLFSLFSIGKIPSGSKDPFGLRRAANVILKIALNDLLDFSLSLEFLGEIFKAVGASTKSGYKEFDLVALQEFFIERLESIFREDFGISTQVFRSVSKGENKQIQAMRDNALALQELLKRDDKESLIAVFKRVANITKDMGESSTKSNTKSSTAGTKNPQKDSKIDSILIDSSRIDSSLFAHDAERDLFSAFDGICKAKDTYQNPKDFLEALFSLKSLLEKFFDAVLVNDENPKIRANRKALMFKIYSEFKQVGDLKELAI
ncbi:glycine--tRNA ligase subunit beta [Helicobacter sp. T3_23-1056]